MLSHIPEEKVHPSVEGSALSPVEGTAGHIADVRDQYGVGRLSPIEASLSVALGIGGFADPGLSTSDRKIASVLHRKGDAIAGTSGRFETCVDDLE